MITIKSANDAVNCIKPFYNDKDTTVEHCAIILLNTKNRVTGIEFVSMGSENQCIVPNKVIAKKAILALASGVILFHNHPSGDPKPSFCDKMSTEELKKMLNVLDIDLTDHIILGEDTFFSFSEEKESKINPD